MSNVRSLPKPVVHYERFVRFEDCFGKKQIAVLHRINGHPRLGTRDTTIYTSEVKRVEITSGEISEIETLNTIYRPIERSNVERVAA